MPIPVIVVDDEPTDRYIVKRKLSRTPGFGEIGEARDGEEFLSSYCGGPAPDTPPLVLMDINMPRRDGFQVIEELERRIGSGACHRTAMVVMLTSSDRPEDKERARAFNLVKGFFTKPLDDADIDTIRELMSA